MGDGPARRDARVAEIESDLWESVQGGDRTVDILARLAFGIVDDLVWRTTHDLIRETSARRTAAFGLIVTFATLVIVAALWFIDAARVHSYRSRPLYALRGVAGAASTTAPAGVPPPAFTAGCAPVRNREP